MAVSKVEMAVPAKKTIALVAHDNMKDELLEWVFAHKEALSHHTLVGTGTTGRLVHEQTGLEVERLRSGPLGGDQQIGARISEGEVDVLLFFWDPLEPQPHDPDIKALLRIAVVWNIPVPAIGRQLTSSCRLHIWISPTCGESLPTSASP